VEAFKNQSFLLSEEARSLRILSEYQEPKTRLAADRVARAIVFFGSARTQPGTNGNCAKDHYRMAADLAERLARWTLAKHSPDRRYYLCSGGGPGIMQAVHEGGARVDQHLNVGLSISLPMEQKPNEFLLRERNFDFHYFFMRKFWFMNLSDAFVIFPGGFGTMDELFEVLTLTQTRRASRRPIVLFDRAFWDETVNFPGLATRGLIDAADLDLFHYADTVEDAFNSLTSRLKD
jgi:hypothetical protein